MDDLDQTPTRSTHAAGMSATPSSSLPHAATSTSPAVTFTGIGFTLGFKDAVVDIGKLDLYSTGQYSSINERVGPYEGVIMQNILVRCYRVPLA